LHAQGRRFYGYKLIDRQALLAFAREVSSVALSHFQQIATRVAVGAASTAALPGRARAGRRRAERKRILKYHGVSDRMAVSWLLALADRGRC